MQVLDQPDVYETSDLPESEQNEFVDAVETTDAIEVLHISSKEAHGKFANKVLDSSRVDFSDRISSKPRTGYQSRYYKKMFVNYAHDIALDNVILLTLIKLFASITRCNFY